MEFHRAGLTKTQEALGSRLKKEGGKEGQKDPRAKAQMKEEKDPRAQMKQP